jgi:hypothetical protein
MRRVETMPVFRRRFVWIVGPDGNPAAVRQIIEVTFQLQ